MALYVSGALAYDRIMNFAGKFNEQIYFDTAHTFNAHFPIDKLEEKFGGTAGNIAYGLALLGEISTILASVGKDFASYKKHLQNLGLPLVGITEYPSELTAGAYIMSDQDLNQITSFHGAAMNCPSKFPFPTLSPQDDFAIISPSGTQDMLDHSQIYKKHKLRFICDPSQHLNRLTANEILNLLRGSMLLITNNYELELLLKITKVKLKDIFELTPAIITTLNEKGVRISYRNGEIFEVKAVTSKVIDPTGAGDAFRSGLIKGIVSNLNLVEAAKLGAVNASFCIESYGTQSYNYTQKSFALRYEKNFKEKLPINFKTSQN